MFFDMTINYVCFGIENIPFYSQQSPLPRHHLVRERLVLDVPVVHEGEGHDDDERREVLRVEHEVVSL